MPRSVSHSVVELLSYYIPVKWHSCWVVFQTNNIFFYFCVVSSTEECSCKFIFFFYKKIYNFAPKARSIIWIETLWKKQMLVQYYVASERHLMQLELFLPIERMCQLPKNNVFSLTFTEFNKSHAMLSEMDKGTPIVQRATSGNNQITPLLYVACVTCWESPTISRLPQKFSSIRDYGHEWRRTS